MLACCKCRCLARAEPCGTWLMLVPCRDAELRALQPVLQAVHVPSNLIPYSLFVDLLEFAFRWPGCSAMHVRRRSSFDSAAASRQRGAVWQSVSDRGIA